MVAGAGTGIQPWAAWTQPLPSGSGEAKTRSTPSSARPATTPTTSTIASSAPTSWKWTWSAGMPWTAALGLGQQREDAHAALLHWRGERAALDDRAHVREVAVGLLLGGVDEGARAGDEAALAALGVERPAGHPELLQLSPERAEVQPGVDQRAEGHVTRDPREAVEVDCSHQCQPPRLCPAAGGSIRHDAGLCQRMGRGQRTESGRAESGRSVLQRLSVSVSQCCSVRWYDPPGTRR